MDRDELEHLAKDLCPTELWYELLDVIDDLDNESLLKHIGEWSCS